MRLDDLPTSDRIEDRRGLSGGHAGLGVGTVVILGLLAWAFGIDPRVLIGGAETGSNGQTQQQTDAGSTGAPSDDIGRFLSVILGSTEVEWKDPSLKPAKPTNRRPSSCFQALPSRLAGVCASRNGSVLLSDRPESLPRHTVSFRTSSVASGLAIWKMQRPTICRTSLYGAQRSVIAFENQLGILTKVQEARSGMDKAEANALQVRVELQAIALPAVLGEPRPSKSGDSSNLVMLRLPLQTGFRQSEMIVCNDGPSSGRCPTHHPTAPRAQRVGGY